MRTLSASSTNSFNTVRPAQWVSLRRLQAGYLSSRSLYVTQSSSTTVLVENKAGRTNVRPALFFVTGLLNRNCLHPVNNGHRGSRFSAKPLHFSAELFQVNHTDREIYERLCQEQKLAAFRHQYSQNKHGKIENQIGIVKCNRILNVLTRG